MSGSNEVLRILRLVTAVGETTAAYNQFSLPARAHHRTTICTYFPCAFQPAPGIDVAEGDGTLVGFWRTIRRALEGGEYDVIHAHMPSVALLFLGGNLLYRRPRRSTMFTVHNSYRSFRLRHRLMLVVIFAAFGRIVHCSRSSRESFPSVYRKLGGNRLYTVQNGVNLERIDDVLQSLEVRRRRRGITVTSVGRLIPIKNPLLAAAAFGEAADADSHLVFVGDGPLRSELQLRLADLGIDDRVQLTGVITRDDVYRRLGESDLFLSTSRGEGLPIAALEAMACSCPVVLSDIPPHREISSGADFIPLIDPDDERGFADAIRRFIDHAPDERRSIGHACRRLVEQRFDLKRMNGAYEQLYREMADA